MLVLNADEIAAEAVGQTQRGDVHPALLQDLGPRQASSLVFAEVERHACFFQPGQNLLGFGFRDLCRLVVKGRLAEPLFKNASRVQQVIGNDGVEHSHAAFIKDTHQHLAAAEVLRDVPGDLAEFGGSLHLLVGNDMACVVVHTPGL